MAYLTPTDIANRALQHCGATRISAFTETSKNAAESQFVYDKVRQAELRHSLWRFATRRAALRPIGPLTSLFAPLAYNNAVTYAFGQVVVDAGINWVSLRSGNLGQTPGLAPTFWDGYYGPLTADPWSASTPYYPGELVTSGGSIFLALGAYPNLNSHPPSANWQSNGANFSAFNFLSPLGFSTSELTAARNIYRLPSAYLRVAVQDPKTANAEFYASTAGIRFKDWEFEGDYLVTKDSGALIFRFVVDFQNVAAMDGLFCEALAARMALELVEPLTQSGDKAKMIGAMYSQHMATARAVNAIEQGSTDMSEEQVGAPAQPDQNGAGR